MKDFYNWLAGFIDGEGCFTISFHHVRKEHQNHFKVGCSCVINMTIEDKTTLFEIKKNIGGEVRKTRNKTDKWKEQWCWSVSSLDACEKLADLLQQFPLRSRKKKDFDLWCEGLRIMRSKRDRCNWGNWIKSEILSLARIRDKMNTKGKPNSRFYKNYDYIKNTIEEI